MAGMAWDKSEHNIPILADEVCEQKNYTTLKSVLPLSMKGSVLRG